LNLSKGWGSRIESVHPYGYIISTVSIKMKNDIFDGDADLEDTDEN